MSSYIVFQSAHFVGDNCRKYSGNQLELAAIIDNVTTSAPLPGIDFIIAVISVS